MHEPPVAELEEDRGNALPRGRVARRPYVLAASLGTAFLVVALIGTMGPRPVPVPSGEAPTGTATDSGSLAIARSAADSGAIGSARPRQVDLTPNPDYIPGLINLHVDEADVSGKDLGTSVVPVASYQRKLLFSARSELFLIDPSRSNRIEAIARSSQCGRITQAAMNARTAIFVEVAPAGSPLNGGLACPSWGPIVDWTITMVDLTYGTTRQVAAGSIVSSVAAWSQPTGLCVAMAEDAYAFSLPDAATGDATVEVRSQPGDRLLFISAKLAGLSQLDLANSRLVAVADRGSPTGRPGQQAVLETEDWTTPLRVIGYTTGSVSLSRTGDRLAFTSCDSKPACQTITLVGGNPPSVLALPLGAGSVAVDSGSLETLAWASQTSPEYPTSYVGLKNVRWPMLVALIGIDPPDWIYVKSNVLLMVSVSAEGIVRLSEVDLVSAHVSE